MPSDLRRSTMARPIPRVPPVTKATLVVIALFPAVVLVSCYLKLDGFQAHGHAHAAADAEGRGPFLGARALHLVQQGGQDPCAGGADRVADGDRAAIDVGLLGIEAQL